MNLVKIVWAALCCTFTNGPRSKNLYSHTIWFPIFLLIFFFSSILKPQRFPYDDFQYIPLAEVLSRLSLKLKENDTTIEYSPSYCPPLPDDNYNIMNEINQNYSSWDEEEFDAENRNIASYFDIQPGGMWEPKSCTPVHHVVVVVPYRNRPSQLKKFLLYMHPFLQLQLISYKIIIVHQIDDNPFNRGKLLNIGYAEAMKQDKYRCFIFHDVDLLPENLSNIYGCTTQPRHMSSSVNTFRYLLQYPGLFGGVVSILQEHFTKINGFSNQYFGWGGEDDDLFKRIVSNNMSVIRFSPFVSSYQMLPHKKEVASINRFKILRDGNSFSYSTDGISNLTYTVLNYIINPLHTLIQVKL